MTRRRSLEHRLENLGEIREIMNSMKSLAYMETRKLARFLDAQQRVVASMEAVAADLLAFHPQLLPAVGEASGSYLVVGSERGFCGEFNQALLARLDQAADHVARIITVGGKLEDLVEPDPRLQAAVPGAGVVEDLDAVLDRVIRELATLQQQGRLGNLFALYHAGEDEPVLRQLLPPFQQAQRTPPATTLPPLLLQRPEAVLLDLTDQYLFANLHEILYTSLMAESRQRVTHLDGAIQHLDEQSERLRRRYNALRQEEIIEEIEVILLNPAQPQDG